MSERFGLTRLLLRSDWSSIVKYWSIKVLSLEADFVFSPLKANAGKNWELVRLLSEFSNL